MGQSAPHFARINAGRGGRTQRLRVLLFEYFGKFVIMGRFATFSTSPVQPTNRRSWRGYYDRAGRARPTILAFHPVIGLQTVVQKASNISAATLSELFRPGSPMLS